MLTGVPRSINRPFDYENERIKISCGVAGETQLGKRLGKTKSRRKRCGALGLAGGTWLITWGLALGVGGGGADS